MNCIWDSKMFFFTIIFSVFGGRDVNDPVTMIWLKMIHEDMTCWPAEKSGLAPTFDNFVSSFLVGDLGDAILLIYLYIYIYDLYMCGWMSEIPVGQNMFQMAQKHQKHVANPASNPSSTEVSRIGTHLLGSAFFQQADPLDLVLVCVVLCKFANIN